MPRERPLTTKQQRALDRLARAQQCYANAEERRRTAAEVAHARAEAARLRESRRVAAAEARVARENRNRGRMVIACRDAGVPYKEIAALLGITTHGVWKIIEREQARQEVERAAS